MEQMENPPPVAPKPPKPKTLLGRIADLDIYLACLTLAALILCTVSGVFMRYAASRPFHWLEEVQLWCIVWTVFLGACHVGRQNAHIAIDALITLFPMPVRRLATVVASAATIAVLAFLGYYSSMHVLQMYNRNRFTSILGIPYWIVYIVVPVACLVIALANVRLLFAAKPDTQINGKAA